MAITIVPVVNHTPNNHNNNQGKNNNAQLIAESAYVLLNFVQAGIEAHNSGKLKDGIPYIIAGLNCLAALAARSGDTQRMYRDVVNFMLTRSDAELNHLLVLARNRALAK